MDANMMKGMPQLQCSADDGENYEEVGKNPHLFLGIFLFPLPSHPHLVNPHQTLKHKKVLEKL